MAVHNVSSRCGRIFLAETGFLLRRNPDTVRAADIAFVRKDHLPATLPEDAFWPGPPDLAVEVVSPGDTVGEIDEKVQAWLDAGALLGVGCKSEVADRERLLLAGRHQDVEGERAVDGPRRSARLRLPSGRHFRQPVSRRFSRIFYPSLMASLLRATASASLFCDAI